MSYSEKVIKAAYNVYQPTTKKTSALYHVFQVSLKGIKNRYHIRPPIVEVYDALNIRFLYFLPLGLLKSGEISPENEIHLWNNQDCPGESLDMSDVFVTLGLSNGKYEGGTPEQGQEVVDGKWVEVKSNGVTGEGIEDDVQPDFTPVGGDPQAGGMAIGRIPSATARHLHFRLNVPAETGTGGALYPTLCVVFRPSFGIGFGYDFGYNFGKNTGG